MKSSAPAINTSSEKVIIFDSSTIINFTMNGLLAEFRELKRIFNGRFLIPQEVKIEIVDKPLQIKRFELEALKIKELFEEKVLELPGSFGIDEAKISSKTKELMNVANNTFLGRDNPIHIIDSGETACLVLSTMLSEKGIKNVISVDERTIRMLGEKPENLLDILKSKLHTQINSKKENYKFFTGFKFIRSSELIYLAYTKGLVKLKNGVVLDALLYALKFNGCSISDEEINEIKKLAKS
jgi:alkylhydroperoxidase/carboxymuconolactone decarboxylase family protein YurZ